MVKPNARTKCECKPLVVCSFHRDMLGSGLRKRLQNAFFKRDRSVALRAAYLKTYLEARNVLDKVPTEESTKKRVLEGSS